MQVALHYDVKIRSYSGPLNNPAINRQFVREAHLSDNSTGRGAVVVGVHVTPYGMLFGVGAIPDSISRIKFASL
jgi:hypothetical protein